MISSNLSCQCLQLCLIYSDIIHLVFKFNSHSFVFFLKLHLVLFQICPFYFVPYALKYYSLFNIVVLFLPLRVVQILPTVWSAESLIGLGFLVRLLNVHCYCILCPASSAPTPCTTAVSMDGCCICFCWGPEISLWANYLSLNFCTIQLVQLLLTHRCFWLSVSISLRRFISHIRDLGR